MILVLFACDPSVDTSADDTGTQPTDSETTDSGTDSATDSGDSDDSGTTGETGTVPEEQFRIAIATVSSDYASGALAIYETLDNELEDQVLSLSSDPVVRAEGDTLYVLNRAGEDTVRVYEDGALDAPVVEFSTGDGSNPQDIVTCGDHWFVSLWSGDVGVFDADGNRVGNVDLGDWADADGSGEPGPLWTDGDRLWVALSQYDNSSYSSAGGAIVAIDCSSYEVSQSWEVGPNTSFFPDPTTPGSLLVTTGNYYDPSDWSLALDGAIYRFDPDAGELSEALWTEAELGYNVGDVAGDEEHIVLMLNDGYNWYPHCASAEDDWALREGPWMDKSVYAPTMVAAGKEQVFIGARAGWSSPDTVEGIVKFVPESCLELDIDSTTFPPYSMAVMPL